MKLLIWLCLIFVVSAGPLVPTPPQNDDFYTPPQGYESSQPGSILKQRPVPNPLSSIVNTIKVKGAWQLLVRSEDSFGNPNAIVTTIIEPFNANSSKVVSYHFFEDASDIDCAPSYAIQHGSPINTLATQGEMYVVAALLDQGFYVIAPDYEGPKSTFTVGRQSGLAALNSVRAALKSGNVTGVDSNAKVVLHGYSGGTIPVSFASVLAKDYAPDLSSNLIGASLGGFVTNVTDVARVCDGTAFSGLIATALGGILNEYSQYQNLTLSDVSPSYISLWAKRNTVCLIDLITTYFGKNWFTGESRFVTEGWSLISQEPFKSILHDVNLVEHPELVPSLPVFIYQGSIDNIVPIDGSLKTYNQWCEAGVASVEFAEDETNGHITEIVVGAPAALTWIINRMNGVAPVVGCQHTKRFNNFFYPGIAPSILDYFKAAFNSIIGLNLGGDITKDEISLPAAQKVANFQF